MKKISGIVIIGGLIVALLAGYYLVIYRPKLAEKKKLTSPDYITDVIEMKSGNNMMGKILKEAPGYVLIRNAAGTVEISVPRRQIRNIRKTTADDIKAVEDELAGAPEAARKAILFEKEREARLKEYYEERDKREIAAASKGKGRTGSVDAIRAAKESGKIVKGMTESDVIEVYGTPDSKERDVKGNAEREKWNYCSGIKKATVNFYRGVVE